MHSSRAFFHATVAPCKQADSGRSFHSRGTRTGAGIRATPRFPRCYLLRVCSRKPPRQSVSAKGKEAAVGEFHKRVSLRAPPAVKQRKRLERKEMLETAATGMAGTRTRRCVLDARARQPPAEREREALGLYAGPRTRSGHDCVTQASRKLSRPPFRGHCLLPWRRGGEPTPSTNTSPSLLAAMMRSLCFQLGRAFESGRRHGETCKHIGNAQTHCP